MIPIHCEPHDVWHSPDRECPGCEARLDAKIDSEQVAVRLIVDDRKAKRQGAKHRARARP